MQRLYAADHFPTSVFSTPGATMNFKDLPQLNTSMPEHGGIFAGIAGGKDGAPYSALILLDAKPDNRLNFQAACAWGESLGDGAHVPTRDESALLYATVRDAFDQDYWHWTSTPYSGSYAWIQVFYNGSQDGDYKSTERLCRAVRLIQLSA
jgi:hypothetical protein